jgi:hypothetical protein
MAEEASANISLVIKKPLMTKNKSTPYPPGRGNGNKCEQVTSMMLAARSPSRFGT